MKRVSDWLRDHAAIAFETRSRVSFFLNALAREKREPVQWKGGDFGHTDLKAAAQQPVMAEFPDPKGESGPPALPARIPAPGFRPLFVNCSPLLIGYIIDSMIVTELWLFIQKAKMG